MKKVAYSTHLILRLKPRKIPYFLPKKIYKTSVEHYFDKETQKKIAIGKAKYKSKLKEMAVIYEEISNPTNLITIHPRISSEKY